MKKIMRLLFIVAGCATSFSVVAQTQIFGGNTFHTFSSAGTTSGASSNGTYKLYTAVGQPMALSSATLTQTQTGVLSAVSNGIVVYDITPPVITPATSTTLTQGASNTFTTMVTDNVAVGSVKINYRNITATISTLANAPMSSGVNNVFSISIQSSWYDAMGIEYFFTATDTKGNSSRLPADNNTYLRTQLVSNNLPFSNIPFGNKTENYRMVAFPFDLGSESTNAISAIYSGIDITDSTKARMYTYNPAAKKLAEFSKGGFSKNERGRGYWLQTATQKTVTVANVTAPADHRSSLYKIVLKPGWNMIGNPYPVDISWNDVRTFKNDVNVGKVNVYNGSYAEGDVLSAYQGGYVKNTSSADIEVSIPFKGQTQIGGRVKQTPETDISQEAWNINLTINQEGMENHLGGFGMHPESVTGSDWFDNYNPPRFFGMPEVNFSHEETGDLTFSNDMVKTTDYYRWQFIPYGEEGKPNLLTWGDDIRSANQELYLFDEQTLSLTNLLTENRYAFTQQKDSRFSIYFGSNLLRKIRTKEVGASALYPNPLTEERTASLTVSIPEVNVPAQVTIQLFNSTGAVVVTNTRNLAPGIHTLTYAVDQHQSSGMYYYRLAIGAYSFSKIYTGKIIVP